MQVLKAVPSVLCKGPLAVLLLLALAGSALGQTASGPYPTNFTLPVVTLRAPDPDATWAGAPGAFLFFRDGPTNETLNVFYRIGGSASNGVDYATITNTVAIPAGIRTNLLLIDPVVSQQTVTKSVELHLAYPPTSQPINYLIGSPSNAAVFIRPPLTNLPPMVGISTPTNGSIFPPGANIPVCAAASDRDGYVATVEFFAGPTSLGVTTNNPLSAGPMNPFSLTWSNVPPGDYALRALATDNAGASTLSEPVRISVGPPPPLPVVNIVATDPVASEIAPVPPGMGMPQQIDPGVFTVFRSGDTNQPLTVLYSAAGTASNGLDYERLPGSVTIPAGAGSANIVVMPIDDLLVEGTETVVLTLSPIACPALYPPPPGCYQIGPSNVATVSILDNDTATNQPPLVRITSPANKTIFRTPVDIPLFAYARDADDSVATVEFLAGTNLLGLGSPVALSDATAATAYPTNLFSLVWSNVSIGEYVLQARATDANGAVGVSEPIIVAVQPPPPPPTNPPALPVVSIVATDPIAIEGTNCSVRLAPLNPTATWSNWAATGTLYGPYTNCGPKNATFTVRRAGPTNETLNVAYEIGGTATNGADYLPLSGTVQLLAGERSALLTVVPLDDGSPELNRTVILTLKQAVTPAGMLPAYLLGEPRRAAALIIDSNRPRPSTGVLTDKTFHLSADGPDGAWFHVEYTTNMVNWTSICTNQVVNGSINFVDPDAPVSQVRFYRAVPESGPPAF